jgi:hypothetical protein
LFNSKPSVLTSGLNDGGTSVEIHNVTMRARPSLPSPSQRKIKHKQNGIRFGASLKFNLGSEPKNYSALSSSTHVRIVLNHRLQQKHR